MTCGDPNCICNDDFDQNVANLYVDTQELMESDEFPRLTSLQQTFIRDTFLLAQQYLQDRAAGVTSDEH